MMKPQPRSKIPAVFAMLCASLAVAGFPASAQVVFQGLGDLPGGTTESAVFDMSANGQVVVGYSGSASSVQEGFRWTSGTGMVGVGFLAGDDRSTLYGANGDGSILVGRSFNSVTGDFRATEWTPGPGLTQLGDLGTQALAISADGGVIVGASSSAGQQLAVHFTGGGTVSLGDLPGGQVHSAALAVSLDGTTIVGYGGPPETSEQAVFFGPVSLGDLPGGGDTHSNALGVSADGSVIVGSANMDTLTQAFRWTTATGMVSLGTGAAFDVSGDGNVIVGGGQSAGGAFFWRADLGRQDLKAYLQANFASSLPAAFDQWTLTEARAISADARTIAGTGRNPSGQLEAFRVFNANGFGVASSAPEPASLALLTLAGPFGLPLVVAVVRRRRTRNGRFDAH